MKKLAFLIIIIMLALGVAGFWYSHRNTYSKDVLKLEILGPQETGLVQEIEYTVRYKNNGNVRLENPKLIFEYPSNSIISGDSLRVTKESEDFGGAIYPGEEKTFHFKARLLGKEGEAKIAKAWLNYQPKNLTARYESSTTFTTVIQRAPLSFEFDLPSKIEPEEEFQFRINYFSNVDYPLSDLRVIVDYPQGFEFEDSQPKGIADNEWGIGLLNRTEGGRIKISGKLFGEEGEQKVFQAKLGIWQEGKFVLLRESFKGIEIINPGLYITQEINGNPEYIASPGDLLHYEIFFKNIGEDPLTNLFLVSKLEGKPFDFETIKTPSGEFEPGDNSIIFDWRNNSDLQFLDYQEEGEVEFWVELKEDWEFADSQRPLITNTVYLSKSRGVFETKVNSKLEISQQGYFQDEVFGNSGPLPPKVREETTYTITWQAKNYYNSVRNTKAKAILPDNVELTGEIFPSEQSEDITFDSESKEIVWNLGDLEPGVGVTNGAPNISFQLALTPGQEQKGEPADLISEVEISGEDQWTKKILKDRNPSLNTTLPDDPTVSQEQGIVQE